MLLTLEDVCGQSPILQDLLHGSAQGWSRGGQRTQWFMESPVVPATVCSNVPSSVNHTLEHGSWLVTFSKVTK